MSYTITHPEPGFTGSNSGIRFEGGAAELDTITPDVIEVLTANGFTVTGEASDKPAFPEGDPSTEWTGAQLDAYAAAKGVQLTGANKKDEKVALLVKAAEEAAAAAQAPEEAKAAVENAAN